MHLTKNTLLLLFLLTCQTALAQSPPCSPLGQNLIINPSFEQGYYGFTSDFGRGVNNGTHCNCATQGWILVAQINPHLNPGCQVYPQDLSAQYGGPNTTTSFNPNHPSNTSVASAAICNLPLPDHTTGNGFFLTVDPDACAGRAYWKQSLQVCPNTNYYFSVWVQNIAGLPAPTFHFEVDGLPVTAVTDYPEASWVQTAVLWNSGNVDGEASLQLINDLPGCDANDVAIDDLFLGVCAAVDLSSEKLFRYCPGDPSVTYKLSGHAVGFTMPQYQWQHLPANSGAWIDLIGQSDTLLIINSPTEADAGLYRLVAAEQGNIESITCSVFSQSIRLDPNPTYHNVDTVNICLGQSYAGHSTSGLYSDHYQTITGCDSLRSLDLRVRGDVSIYVPNAFTPNDDGNNDQIQPFLSDLNVDVYRWQVFDRWGNQVFETHNPSDSWNGTFRGKPCSAGVYVYSLKMEIRGCQEGIYSGDLMLFR